MEFVKIVVLCVGAAVVYGISHDMVTAHLCVEYFTVGHPPIFGGAKHPIILALGWGVIAAWWVGGLLGVPAALFARLGPRPRLAWRDLRMPVVILMTIVVLVAVIAGISGHVTGSIDQYYFPSDSVDRTPNYVAAASAHQAAYATGFMGGVVLWGWIWWRRGRQERRLLGVEVNRLRAENRELLERLQQRPRS